jgi:pimeloyl-ACP methyl ester carboxylesterase
MAMLSGFPAAYFGIAAFAESDVTEDLKTIDVPTLILHGDDDQIAPVGKRLHRFQRPITCVIPTCSASVNSASRCLPS